MGKYEWVAISTQKRANFYTFYKKCNFGQISETEKYGKIFQIFFAGWGKIDFFGRIFTYANLQKSLCYKEAIALTYFTIIDY